MVKKDLKTHFLGNEEITTITMHEWKEQKDKLKASEGLIKIVYKIDRDWTVWQIMKIVQPIFIPVIYFCNVISARN